MAYLPETELERQKRQEQESGQPTLSGPSGVINPSSQPNTPNQKAPSKSGSYTNLNSYLDANKEQGAQLANTITGNIKNQAETTKSDINNLQSNFQQKINEGAVRQNNQLVDEAVNNPNEFIKDQNKVQQFAKQRDANYAGPNSITDESDYANAVKNIGSVNDNLKSTETEAGRFNLVKQQFGSPTYSVGQQRLDQLILQNNPQARDQFQNLRNDYSDLQSYMNQAVDNTNNQVNQAKADTQASKQYVQDKVIGNGSNNGALTSAQAGVNSRVAQLQSEATSRADMAKRILNGEFYQKAPSEGEQALYNQALQDLELNGFDGMREDRATRFLNKQNNITNKEAFSLADYFTQNPVSNINQNNVATADEYSKIQALNQLMGLDAGSYFANDIDTAKLNSANVDTSTFDYSGAMKRLGDLIFSDENLKTNIKKPSFDEIEKYLKGKK